MGQAAWTRAVTARYFKQIGWDVTAILYDVAKAFDNVHWAVLWREADIHGFPMDLLRFLISLYSAPRIILVGDAVAARSTPRISIVAGCAFADCGMALAMMGLDRKVQLEMQPVITMMPAFCASATVADDYQLLVAAPPALALPIAAHAHKVATKAFAASRLPVHSKKLCSVQSAGWRWHRVRWDAKRIRSIDTAADELAASAQSSVRNLGFDFTFHNRRSTKVGQARKDSFRVRHQRAVIRKRKNNHRMGYFAVGVAVPKLTWGASVNGISDRQLRERRAMVHACIAKNPSGRSVTVDCALSEHRPTTIDPIYVGTTSPIMSLCNAIWDGWVNFSWIATLWNDAFEKAVTPEGAPRWMRAADPMSAAAASLTRAGWKQGGVARLITRDNTQINLRAVAPRTVKILLQRDIELEILARWGAKHQSFRKYGPAAVPWMVPIREVTSADDSRGWNCTHRGALKACVADGLWWPARIAEQVRDVEPNYALCGVCGEVCDHNHVIWRCWIAQTLRGSYNWPKSISDKAQSA